MILYGIQPETQERVYEWAEDVGIIEQDSPRAQLAKLREEVNELIDAHEEGQYISDELGDVFVVLFVYARMIRCRPEYCLRTALDKIEKRQGRIVDGVFVKDEE